MKENLPPEETLTWCREHLDDTLERVHPLRVEASHRTFYRLELTHGSRVLMCSPPALENNEQFVVLAGLFQAARVPVPEVIATQMQSGWFLLEDLGSTHLEEIYAGTERDIAIQAAIDMLPRLLNVQSEHIPDYDVTRFHTELGIFTEWLLAKTVGQEANLQLEFALLVEATQAQPQGCVHRDYHCRNLLWQAGQLGIVDFQDALRGPCLYDLASLLRDCYYTFSEPEVDRWLSHFVAQEPRLADIDSGRVKRWLDFTAIQRQLKAIGIFTRLHLRDGKSSHLKHILPVLERLMNLLKQYPELHRLDLQLMDCKTALLTLASQEDWRGLKQT